MNEPVSKGIVISGGHGNVAYGNTVVGFDTGVHIEGGSANIADSNIIISADASRLYAQLAAVIEKSALPQSESKRLTQALAAMHQSTGQPSFAQRYKDFMAILADHIQVLGPAVMPLLPGLAALL